MSRTVVFAGDKGGSGKTTTSHALCHGLGMHGVRSIHVTTDPRRLVLPADSRRYATVDGREVRQLARVIDQLANRDDVVLVIDGGGGRPEVDAVLSKVADLTVIPFLHSAEDLRVAVADLQRLSHAYGLPNRWPTQTWAKAAAEKELTKAMGDLGSRLMSPLPEINGLITLVSEEGANARINGQCKAFALRILERMGLNLFSFRAPAA
ncbi:hypothetical protein [Azospirillum thermophilum]|uniref:nucleotide-binding protein n=1 Tax=Azospirillum thermophilum TaxID=2202148 RepID=UPI00143CED22|nr:hypothetical protein [Azospirillum thermophilum]